MFKCSPFFSNESNMSISTRLALLNLSVAALLLYGCSSQHSSFSQKATSNPNQTTTGVTLTKMPVSGADTLAPNGYTRLFEVDHSILVNPHADTNPKPIILPTRVAHALKAVNKEAKEQGFNLVVYRFGENELDVSLIVLGKIPHPRVKTELKLYNHESITYYEDGTFNMGTSYLDIRDASQHGSPLVPPQAAVMRNYLRALMGKHGFKADTLWWRYYFS